ncbi:MAG: HAD family hydrolase [Ardenticatenaceae bacterium]|nr:HAD family hydrolase [Ardenticatenaceae bacterium]
MKANKNIKAVIFDLDDTLIDWSGARMSFRQFMDPKLVNVHQYLTDLGFEVEDPPELANRVHDHTRFVWQRALETGSGASLVNALKMTLDDYDIPVEAVDMDEMLRAYQWGKFPGVEPFDDMHRVLDTLKDQGYKIGLVTNAYQPMWMRDVELEEYDMIDYFDARITSGDTGFIKPHPAIYWRMLGLLDLMPDEAIFVGDRPDQDIKGAHSVNMRGVLMSPPHLNRELNGVRPDHTVSSLSELLPILDDLA